MKQKSSVGFISFSAFLHAGALLGLVMIPALKMLPEGEETVVELVSEAAVQAPSPAATPGPAPVATPPPAPVAETKMVEPVPEKVKPQPVAKVLPAKKSAKIIPVDMSEDISKTQDEAEKFAKEQADDIQPMTEVAPAQPVDVEQEVLDTAAQAAAAEAVTKQEEADKIEPLPAPKTSAPVQRLSDIKEETTVQNETPVTASDAEATGDTSGNSLSEFAGPGADELRSHLDLKQLGNNRPPQYPVTARRNGSQGEVLLNYYVTQAGVVQNVKIARSSGYSELDREAVRAISNYKYVAGQEGWTSHPVMFSLKGPTAAQPGRLRTSGSSVQGE